MIHDSHSKADEIAQAACGQIISVSIPLAAIWMELSKITPIKEVNNKAASQQSVVLAPSVFTTARIFR